MGNDWYFERMHRGVLPENVDSHWHTEYKKLKALFDEKEKELEFMESLLNVEQRRKIREYRNDR